LSLIEREQIKQTLYSFINTILTSNVASYVINKAFQVHISIWKRGWLTISVEEKDSFLQHIYLLVTSSPNDTSNHQSIAGVKLLRVLIEEFSNKSFAEINLPLEFHEKVKENFLKNDFQKVLFISCQSLSHTMASIIQFPEESIINDQKIIFLLIILSENFKLFNEIISWNFFEKRTNSEEINQHRILFLPREWGPLLIQSDLLQNVFKIYAKIRQFYLFFLGVKNKEISGEREGDVLEVCLTEIGNLISNFAGVSGDIFKAPVSDGENKIKNDEDEKKIFFADFIISECIILTRDSFVRTISPADADLTVYSADYLEGKNREKELVFFLTVISRLLSNLKLDKLIQLSQFENLMLSLGGITLEMAKEMSIISHYVVSFLEKVDSKDFLRLRSYYNSEKLLDSWRGVLMTLCLDLWCLFLDDSLFLMNYGKNEGILASRDFKNWLENISNEIFPQCFNFATNCFIYDSIVSMDEDEGEEDECIESRETMDLMIGICTIGRRNFFSSILKVSEFLQKSIIESEFLYSTSNASSIQIVKSMENIRIGIIVINHLFSDNYAEDQKFFNGEYPIINNAIVNLFGDAIHNGGSVTNSLFMIFSELLLHLNRFLKFQNFIIIDCVNKGVNLNQFVSPVLIKLILKFFSEFIFIFCNPDVSNYNPDIHFIIHIIQANSGKTKLFLFCFVFLINYFSGEGILQVLPSILDGINVVINYLPFETEVVLQASNLIRALACVINGIQFKGIDNSIQIIELIELISNRKQNGAELIQCRLNFEGLSAVYNTLGILFVNTNNSEGFNKVFIFYHK
jgi:hypothetical protein